MSDPTLPLFMMIIAALIVTGMAGGIVARDTRRVLGFIGAAIAGLGAMLTLLFLIFGDTDAALALPLGPPGLTLRLSLDGLAAFFLFLVFLAGTAGIAVAAEAEAGAPHVTLAGIVLCLAGVILTMLAADGITVALGLSLTGSAIWASGEPGRPRAAQLGITLLAAAALMLATAFTGPGFAAMRAEPGHADAILILTLIGAGGLAGLVPLHGWVLPAYRAAPARIGALLSGAVQPLATYLMVRLILDIAGATPPVWWSVPLLAMGGMSVVRGGWLAVTEADIDSCLAAGAIRQSGFTATGLGLALLGRATDLPDLTMLALTAVLLLALTQAVCGTLSHLAAGAVRVGAGSRRLTLLGGLIHPMPIVTLSMAAGQFGLAALPAGGSFAAIWLLFQAVLVAPRSGGVLSAIGLVAVAAGLALGAALSTVALIRLLGVVFLGRPRGPRAAGAEDIARPARPGLLALTGVTAVVGLLPGPALRLLGGTTIQQLTHEPVTPLVGFDGLYPLAGGTGYLVLPLILVFGLFLATTLATLRRQGGPAPRVNASWVDGFAPPPPWLPFGDPLTQTAGVGFVPAWSIRRIQPRLPTLPRRLLRPDWSAGTWTLLLGMALLLTGLAWTAHP